MQRDYLMKPKFGERSTEKCMAFCPQCPYGRLPGTGKTLLARALPGILPEMSIEESLDVTRIFSVAD